MRDSLYYAIILYVFIAYYQDGSVVILPSSITESCQVHLPIIIILIIKL